MITDKDLTMEDSMVLRHVTPIENVQSILSDGKLSAEYSPRKQSSDRGFVSLEVYTGSSFMEQLCCRKSKVGKTFAFLFCKRCMLEAGIEFKSGQGFRSKNENILYVVNGSISQKEYDQIGDYFFVKGEVALKFLTDECKAHLRAYAEEANIQFDEKIFADVSNFNAEI